MPTLLFPHGTNKETKRGKSEEAARWRVDVTRINYNSRNYPTPFFGKEEKKEKEIGRDRRGKGIKWEKEPGGSFGGV